MTRQITGAFRRYSLNNDIFLLWTWLVKVINDVVHRREYGMLLYNRYDSHWWSELITVLKVLIGSNLLADLNRDHVSKFFSTEPNRVVLNKILILTKHTFSTIGIMGQVGECWNYLPEFVAHYASTFCVWYKLGLHYK